MDHSYQMGLALGRLEARMDTHERRLDDLEKSEQRNQRLERWLKRLAAVSMPLLALFGTGSHEDALAVLKSVLGH